MAELLTLVQTYLGPIDTPKHLNLYSALGLEEFSGDRAAISTAVEKAIDRLKKADRTTDHEGFEEVVKIVRHARSVLLDADKKATYDTQLKKVFSKKVVANEKLGNIVPNELDRLSGLFPAGDPHAPFSLAEHLKSRSENVEYESIEDRLLALQQLIDMSPESSDSVSNDSLSSGQSANITSTSAKELHDQLRRKRQKRNLWTSGILIGAACVVVGMGFWMVLRSQSDQASRREAQHVDTLTTEESRAQPLEQTEKAVSSVASNGGNRETAQVAPTEKSKSSTKTRMNLGVVKSSTPTSESPEPRRSLPKIGETLPIEEPSMKSDLPMEIKKTGELAIKAVLESIRNRDFQRFESEIEKANNIELDSEQRKTLDQLNLVGQLVQMGDEAFRMGIASLRSTNTIPLGEASQAIVVEIDIDKNLLIARVKGKNEKMAIDKLPIDWVLAVASLKLSDSPVDDAVRGTLLQWDYRATDVSRKSAKNFFDRASKRESKFSGLEEVYFESSTK